MHAQGYVGIMSKGPINILRGLIYLKKRYVIIPGNKRIKYISRNLFVINDNKKLQFLKGLIGLFGIGPGHDRIGAA